MKKATLINTALLLTAAAASPVTALGASTQLQVKGVIRPSACIPTLPGGGALDYPGVNYRSLSQTESNRLPTKEIELSISCDAPTRMGIRTIDNRSSSNAPQPVLADRTALYGLGTVSGANIGAFYLGIDKVRGPAGPVDVLVRNSQPNAAWIKSNSGAVRSDTTLSWGAVGTVALGTYQSITATLSVTPVLNRANLLPANQAITLDGATTIEIVYL